MALLLTENSPRVPQPVKINTPLWLHQKAAIHLGNAIEASVITGTFVEREGISIRSTTGILADSPGLGKTNIMLGIIASSTLINNIAMFKKTTVECNKFGYFYEELNANVEGPTPMKTTLIIVPQGPVFEQWKAAIAKTSLTCLTINNANELSAVPIANPNPTFEKYDIVLTKASIMPKFFKYFKEVISELHWARIVLDEAHTLAKSIGYMKFIFLWGISATMVTHYTNNKNPKMSSAIYFRNMLMVKSSPAFSELSISLPLVQEHSYKIRTPNNMQVLQGMVSNHIMDLLSTGDVVGAARMLSKKDVYETDIVKLVCENMDYDLLQVTRKLRDLKTDMDSNFISEAAYDARLKTLTTKKEQLESKIAMITERVSNVQNKDCEICYGNVIHPIYLSCTHIYCTECLAPWMKKKMECPTCRTPIDSSKILRIVPEDQASTSRGEPAAKVVPPPPTDIKDKLHDTKLACVLAILNVQDPSRQTLIFSDNDAIFKDLVKAVNADGIKCKSLPGNSIESTRFVENFRKKKIRVLVIDTAKFAAGIDLSCASDIILMNKMTTDISTQCIGRAQRVGRTGQLQVHNVYYTIE
jgi:hypothetical protein